MKQIFLLLTRCFFLAFLVLFFLNAISQGIADGVYKIKSKNVGYVLGIEKDRLDIGGILMDFNDEASAGQYWYVKKVYQDDAGNYGYSIKNLNSGYYLSVNGTINQTKLLLRQNQGPAMNDEITLRQKFYISSYAEKKEEEHVYYKLFTSNMPGYYTSLAVTNDMTPSGYMGYQDVITNQDNQWFEFIPVNTHPIVNGTYLLFNRRGSTGVLSVKSNTNNVIESFYRNKGDQQWELQYLSAEEGYRITNQSTHQVLTLGGVPKTTIPPITKLVDDPNGPQLIETDWNNNDNQKWFICSLATGGYVIKSKASMGLVVTVNSISSVNDIPVTQRVLNLNDNTIGQSWDIDAYNPSQVKIQDGYYMIGSANDDKFLHYVSTNNPNKYIQQYDGSGGLANELFKVESVVGTDGVRLQNVSTGEYASFASSGVGSLLKLSAKNTNDPTQIFHIYYAGNSVLFQIETYTPFAPLKVADNGRDVIQGQPYEFNKWPVDIWRFTKYPNTAFTFPNSNVSFASDKDNVIRLSVNNNTLSPSVFLNTANQKWNINLLTGDDNSYCSISNNDKYITASLSDMTISLGDWTGTDNQKWLMCKRSDNTQSDISKDWPLLMINKANGSLLVMSSDGSTIQQSSVVDPASLTSEQWRIGGGYDRIADGVYVLFSTKTWGSMSVNRSNFKIEQYNFKNQANEQWEIHSLADGYYRITNPVTAKVVSVSSSDTSIQLVATDVVEGDAKQEWSFIKKADSSYAIISKYDPAKAIDLSSGSSIDGNGIIAYPYDANNANQGWALENYSVATQPFQDGFYYFKNLSNPLGKIQAMDLLAASLNNEAKAIVHEYFGATNQAWRVIKNNDSAYLIQNVNSGKYLSLASNSSNNLVSLVQKDRDVNDPTQSFHFYYQGSGKYEIETNNAYSFLINNSPNVVQYSKPYNDLSRFWSILPYANVSNSGGVYNILSAVNNQSATDVLNTPISFTSFINSVNQYWNIKKLSGVDSGYFQVSSKVSPELFITASLTNNDITNSSWTNADNQKWLLELLDNKGTAKFRNKATGNLMAFSSTVNTFAQIPNYNTDGTAEKFQIQQSNQVDTPFVNGTYILFAKKSWSTLTVNNIGSIEEYRFRNIINDRWIITALSNGYYSFKNENTNKVIAMGTSSAQLVTKDWDGADDQQWYFKKKGDGFYAIISKKDPTLAIDLNVGSPNNGTEIDSYPYAATNDNQSWYIEKYNADSVVVPLLGAYAIKNNTTGEYINMLDPNNKSYLVTNKSNHFTELWTINTIGTSSDGTQLYNLYNIASGANFNVFMHLPFSYSRNGYVYGAFGDSSGLDELYDKIAITYIGKGRFQLNYIYNKDGSISQTPFVIAGIYDQYNLPDVNAIEKDSKLVTVLYKSNYANVDSASWSFVPYAAWAKLNKVANETYTFALVANSKGLSFNNGQLIQDSLSSCNCQQWQVELLGGKDMGYCRLSNTGLFLSALNYPTSNALNLQEWHDGDDQKWFIDSTNNDYQSFVKIRLKKLPSLILSVPEDKINNNGTNFVLVHDSYKDINSHLLYQPNAAFANDPIDNNFDFLANDKVDTITIANAMMPALYLRPVTSTEASTANLPVDLSSTLLDIKPMWVVKKLPNSSDYVFLNLLTGYALTVDSNNTTTQPYQAPYKESRNQIYAIQKLCGNYVISPKSNQDKYLSFVAKEATSQEVGVASTNEVNQPINLLTLQYDNGVHLPANQSWLLKKTSLNDISNYNGTSTAKSAYDIMLYWAPRIVQAMAWHGGLSPWITYYFNQDIPTSFTFDSTWNVRGKDKETQNDNGNLPLYVHYLIRDNGDSYTFYYAVYYTADKGEICWEDHSGDWESFNLTVKKDGTDYGKFVSVSLSAHGGGTTFYAGDKKLNFGDNGHNLWIYFAANMPPVGLIWQNWTLSYPASQGHGQDLFPITRNDFQYLSSYLGTSNGYIYLYPSEYNSDRPKTRDINKVLSYSFRPIDEVRQRSGLIDYPLMDPYSNYGGKIYNDYSGSSCAGDNSHAGPGSWTQRTSNYNPDDAWQTIVYDYNQTNFTGDPTKHKLDPVNNKSGISNYCVDYSGSSNKYIEMVNTNGTFTQSRGDNATYYYMKNKLENFDIQICVNTIMECLKNDINPKAGIMVRADANNAQSPYIALYLQAPKDGEYTNRNIGIAIRQNLGDMPKIVADIPTVTASTSPNRIAQPILLRIRRQGKSYSFYWATLDNPNNFHLISQQNIDIATEVNVGFVCSSEKLYKLYSTGVYSVDNEPVFATLTHFACSISPFSDNIYPCGSDNPAMQGKITIGEKGDFTSIRSFLYCLKRAQVMGPIHAYLIDSIYTIYGYDSYINPLTVEVNQTINAINTVTISPTKQNTVISGGLPDKPNTALITFLGSSYITLDGSLHPDDVNPSKDITIDNLYGGMDVLIAADTNGVGASYITLKNLNFIHGSIADNSIAVGIGMLADQAVVPTTTGIHDIALNNILITNINRPILGGATATSQLKNIVIKKLSVIPNPFSMNSSIAAGNGMLFSNVNGLFIDSSVVSNILVPATYALQVSNSNNIAITSNDMAHINSGGSIMGISIVASSNVNIRNNDITDLKAISNGSNVYGVVLDGCTDDTVSNNTISQIMAQQFTVGLYLKDITRANVCNNSISLSGSIPNPFNYYGTIIGQGFFNIYHGSGASLVLKGNVLSNTESNSNSNAPRPPYTVLFYSAPTPTPWTSQQVSDYNVFYTSNDARLFKSIFAGGIQSPLLLESLDKKVSQLVDNQLYTIKVSGYQTDPEITLLSSLSLVQNTLRTDANSVKLTNNPFVSDNDLHIACNTQNTSSLQMPFFAGMDSVDQDGVRRKLPNSTRGAFEMQCDNAVATYSLFGEDPNRYLFSNDSISIVFYPNPFANHLNVQLSKSKENVSLFRQYKIEVYDNLGVDEGISSYFR